MANNSDIIGAYRGTVKNRVVTALLQSYLDILDYDGMKSILREAELLDLKDIRDVDPEGEIDFFSFKKLIAAQNCLLYDSSQILFALGKKFSFYLFPYGKNFEEVVMELNHLIKTNWNIEILDKSTDHMTNEIETITLEINNCIFCSEVGVPCNFIIGFLVHSLEKSLPSNREITYSGLKDPHDPSHSSFILKLISKKKE